MTYDAEGEIGTGKGTISMRALLHLDADAFFASVEQALDPRLRGRPVIVGGSYRGVVSSASYEARKFGVHSAMPIARAEQLCPNAVFLHGQYSQYEEYSDELFSICRQYAPEVEQSSIDEGVLDLTGTERYHRGRYPKIARHIQATVWKRLEITVSEGLATNKTVAKVASDLKKPNGLVAVPRGTEREFLAPLDLKRLPGAGPVLTRKLADYGIRTVGEFAQLPREWVLITLGKGGVGLHQHANGVDERPVRPTRDPQKSMSHQETFDADTIDTVFVLGVACRGVSMLLTKLRAQGRTARTVGLKIRYGDFQESQSSRSLDEPLDIDPPFYRILEELLPTVWQRRVRIRQVAVTLSNFYTASMQLDLFDENKERMARLYRSVDAIRSRYGFDAVGARGVWTNGRPPRT